MAICPACAKENPEGFQFCGFCSAPLTGQGLSAAVQEERKVVSVLFCDLVGFTAASEVADPEDVRARLRPYHARLRGEIERYGGTVEKFIGDAVMAVFGAPVAHEDDAERGVRAGLRILEAIEELNEADPGLSLQVRVGISTGEGVVALGARPEEGEGMVTGDVVNTAARLQAAAPVDGIAVSEQTYRQTDRIFAYEQLPLAEVKGKAEPLSLWRPLAARSRFGTDLTRTHTTPLVGRDLEKQLLIGSFERAMTQRAPQLVTIVGEPGVGKSRLCSELFRYIDDHPGFITWRQGRCLPYGDGIAFWALGEIVKAHCGILESDPPGEAAAKLDAALTGENGDRAWLRARLAPLVGAGGEPASQEESFTAWRRYLESLAAEQPAVLCFEDLHWADDALLAFLEHLADWAGDVPLLLLCTARPELQERHPTWAAGLRNATTISLAPLSDEETARLLSLLLERSVLPAETQRTLLERTGGNPLYAEEFVRLLADREQLSGALEAAPLPDSIQALIAARLDTLSPERKTLLQDAAVVGKVFWAGALAAMGDRDLREVELTLHELARKELVRAARTTSMEGESEYAFWHVVVRDVSYSQIPRAARAARHRAAAGWIQSKAGDRVEDLADVLAYHYVEALELARAAGETAKLEELEDGARRFLTLAGERALPLDVGHAEASLAKALELAQPGHPDRARLLEAWAHAAFQRGRPRESKEAFEEAVALYRAQNDPISTGRVLTALLYPLWTLGDPTRMQAIAEAVRVLETQPPGPELVAAYAELASRHGIDLEYHDAIELADRAIDLAAELGLPPPGRALGWRGLARAKLGDRDGLADLRLAQERMLEEGRSRALAANHSHLSEAIWLFEGPEAGLPDIEAGIAFSERRGLTVMASALPVYRLRLLIGCGRISEAQADAETAARQATSNDDFPTENVARSAQLLLLAQCGEPAPTDLDPNSAVSRARASGIRGNSRRRWPRRPRTSPRQADPRRRGTSRRVRRRATLP